MSAKSVVPYSVVCSVRRGRRTESRMVVQPSGCGDCHETGHSLGSSHGMKCGHVARSAPDEDDARYGRCHFRRGASSHRCSVGVERTKREVGEAAYWAAV